MRNVIFSTDGETRESVKVASLVGLVLAVIIMVLAFTTSFWHRILDTSRGPDFVVFVIAICTIGGGGPFLVAFFGRLFISSELSKTLLVAVFGTDDAPRRQMRLVASLFGAVLMLVIAVLMMSARYEFPIVISIGIISGVGVFTALTMHFFGETIERYVSPDP